MRLLNVIEALILVEIMFTSTLLTNLHYKRNYSIINTKKIDMSVV